MKKLFFLLVAAAGLVACGGDHDQGVRGQGEDSNYTYYGASITPDGAITTDELVANMEGQTSMDAKVQATIKETCLKMGCWMTVDLADGEDMMVFMKDHEFFVPKEGATGLDCIIEGTAYYDTLSVEWLQHLAEDAGKSAEEIAMITEPEFQLAFDANGVIIDGYYPSEDESEEAEEEHDHDHEHEHGEEVEHEHEHDETDETHEHDHGEGEAQ